jgi:hypothetical protein
MNYSLGNMLSRGGSLNADKLSLDLQFATDKTLTARRGPTPTFTRASTATFVGSNGLIQSAAINAARFDHDPVTLACKGLLIEEARTNLVFPSATLTTQTRTVTAVAHTLSFYGTGTVVLSGAHIATVTGTGAYPTRTTLTFTPSAGSLILTVTGTVTEAQLEAGAFPTSYIPTVASSVVRSADVCSITGSAFSGFYNQSQGTLFAECQALSANQYAGIAVIGTTSFNHNIALFKSDTTGGTVGNRFVPYVTQAGALVATHDFGNQSGNGNLKVLASVALNNMIFARNGTLSPLDSTAAMPTPDRITIGGRADGNYINGHIAAIRYYRKRLPDAKLQTITV